MTPEILRTTFQQFDFSTDVRSSPDERRRGRFRAGWKNATIRKRVYPGEVLDQLTWDNLGYRFGKELGEQPDDSIDAAFDILADMYRKSRDQSAPSASQYMSAFRALEPLSEIQLEMLRVHYQASAHTITATQLAESLGYRRYAAANSLYGRLGRLVSEQLAFKPDPERLGTLVNFEKKDDEWHWIMRPQVVQALESLGWFEASDNAATLTDKSSVEPRANRQTGYDSLGSDVKSILTSRRESTVKECLVNARIGQGAFRAGVLTLWGGRCCVTGSTTTDAIRASHIKPWKESTNDERLDPYNGLPLLATFDALFDAGLISFAPDGRLLVSPSLSEDEQQLLNLSGRNLIHSPMPETEVYLAYHRDRIFLGSDAHR